MASGVYAKGEDKSTKPGMKTRDVFQPTNIAFKPDGSGFYVADGYGAYVIDLFGDDAFRHPHMWSADRLHLSPAGHRRVAAHVLNALGVGVEEEWMLVPPMPEPTPWLLARGADLRWAREYFAPWINRHLLGHSSGDMRAPKRPELTPVSE